MRNRLNAPNKVSLAQEWITTLWLTPYSTAVERKSCTDFSTCYPRNSTPLATNSHVVVPITSDTWFHLCTPGAIPKTWNSDSRWWQTLRNCWAISQWNLAHAYRSSTSLHRTTPRFMEIKIDIALWWLRRSRNATIIHKNWTKPMQIVWKPTGDRLGGICWLLKNSSTIFPRQTSATLSGTILDRWRLPASDLSPGRNSLIRLRPRKLPMSKTRSHSSSINCNNNSSRYRQWTHPPKGPNERSILPSASQATPTDSNPANGYYSNMSHQTAEDNCQDYGPHHWSQQKFSTANILLLNSYTVYLRTGMRASVLNTHKEVTHHSRTRQ